MPMFESESELSERQKKEINLLYFYLPVSSNFKTMETLFLYSFLYFTPIF